MQRRTGLEDLKTSGSIPLSAADVEMIGSLSANPPPPNEALKRAIERRREVINPESDTELQKA